MSLNSVTANPILLDLEQRVHGALSSWHSDASAVSQLAGLATVMRARAVDGVATHHGVKQILLAALNVLATSAPADAHLLRRRFLDDRPVYIVARELSIAEATLYKRQRHAIGRLAAIVADMERQARGEHIARAEAHLPWVDYHRLFGIEPVLRQLSGLLSSGEAPWIILLSGIGGQGKTTIARSAMEGLVHDSNVILELGWVSAQQQSFRLGKGIVRVDAPALSSDDLLLTLATQLLPASLHTAPFSGQSALKALQTYLRDVPHVIVIDNLETLIDVEALLPTLRRLVGPSRFLITSRITLPGEHDIFHLAVPELSEQDALELVRFEARMRNLTSVSGASDEDLRPIYETVGGNPLALKLVAGQLFLLPLPELLTGLRQARGKSVMDLYHFIYWNAWNQLDADAKEVLLCMPMFAQGGADFTAIERVSETKGGQLTDALEYLTNVSLVSVSGDLWTRRYSIHRLTETFLLNEVIRWQGLTQVLDDEFVG